MKIVIDKVENGYILVIAPPAIAGQPPMQNKLKIHVTLEDAIKEIENVMIEECKKVINP